MKKTLTTELYMTILWVTLGVLGFYFLNSSVKIWVLPLFTAMILLGYLVRWQFLIAAGLLMPLITSLLTFYSGFSLVNMIITMVELIATGLLVCFAYQHWKWQIHSALVFGILFGRIFGGIGAWIMKALFGQGSFSNLYQYTINSLTGNIRGIAVELAFIPLIVLLVFQRFYNNGKRR